MSLLPYFREETHNDKGIDIGHISFSVAPVSVAPAPMLSNLDWWLRNGILLIQCYWIATFVTAQLMIIIVRINAKLFSS